MPPPVCAGSTVACPVWPSGLPSGRPGRPGSISLRPAAPRPGRPARGGRAVWPTRHAATSDGGPGTGPVALGPRAPGVRSRRAREPSDPPGPAIRVSLSSGPPAPVTRVIIRATRRPSLSESHSRPGLRLRRMRAIRVGCQPGPISGSPVPLSESPLRTLCPSPPSGSFSRVKYPSPSSESSIRVALEEGTPGTAGGPRSPHPSRPYPSHYPGPCVRVTARVPYPGLVGRQDAARGREAPLIRAAIIRVRIRVSVRVSVRAILPETHARTHAHTHERTHARTQTHRHTHTYTHTRICALSRTLTHTRTQHLPLPQGRLLHVSPSPPRTHKHTQTHTDTHRHTQTHTHTRLLHVSPSPPAPPSCQGCCAR